MFVVKFVVLEVIGTEVEDTTPPSYEENDSFGWSLRPKVPLSEVMWTRGYKLEIVLFASNPPALSYPLPHPPPSGADM